MAMPGSKTSRFSLGKSKLFRWKNELSAWSFMHKKQANAVLIGDSSDDILSLASNFERFSSAKGVPTLPCKAPLVFTVRGPRDSQEKICKTAKGRGARWSHVWPIDKDRQTLGT